MKSAITIILVNESGRRLFELNTLLEFTHDSKASDVCALAKNKLAERTKETLGEAKIIMDRKELKPTDILKDFTGQYICKITKA